MRTFGRVYLEHANTLQIQNRQTCKEISTIKAEIRKELNLKSGSYAGNIS